MPLGKGPSEAPLSAAQVLYRLVDLEENGARFYEGVVNGTHSEWVRRLAAMLLVAEKRHHARFLKYAAMAETSDSETDGSQPLTPELAHLLNAQAFASKEQVEKSAQYASDLDMIKVAIRAEENIALLMTELCDYVPKNQRTYIKRVVKEEWGHKASLEELLRKHFGAQGG